MEVYLLDNSLLMGDSTAGAPPLASKDLGLLVLLSVFFEIP